MARVNVKVKATKPAAVYTHEGALAINISPMQQLRRLVLSCMLFEGTFYVDGKSSVQAIDEAVGAVLKTYNGPREIAELAVETRSQGKLRHAPLYLAVSLIKAGKSRTKLGEECRAVVADMLARVIQRPDELAEIVAMYWKPKKQPLTNQMKKGLAASFNKFNEYSLSKYANHKGSVSLRDVLFLCHARPKDSEQAELWKKLAEKKLVAPDTWESNLSAGADKKETFSRLLQEKKLGALALIRNLRNMQQSGVSEDLIRQGLQEMSVERVLPFRFISAANYAPRLEPELEQAMFKCLEGSVKLPGKTVLMIDNSGSMYGSKISTKSEIDRSDAACALAMLLREVSERVEVVVFSDSAITVAPRRGFSLRDVIKKATTVSGTQTERGKKLADSIGYDRLIIFTDEQSHTSLSDPLRGSRGYVINVATYQHGIGYGKWVHIDGFSESCIDFIQQYEGLKEE